VDVPKLKQQAAAHESQGELDLAIARYRQVLDHLEGTPRIKRELPIFAKVGDLLAKTGDSTSAIEMYGRAAEHYAQHGSAKSIAVLCLKVLRVDRKQTDVYLRFARLLLDHGHVDACRKVLIDYAERAKLAKTSARLRSLADRPDAEVAHHLEQLFEKAGRRERPPAPEPEPPGEEPRAVAPVPEEEPEEQPEEEESEAEEREEADDEPRALRTRPSIITGDITFPSEEDTSSEPEGVPDQAEPLVVKSVTDELTRVEEETVSEPPPAEEAVTPVEAEPEVIEGRREEPPVDEVEPVSAVEDISKFLEEPAILEPDGVEPDVPEPVEPPPDEVRPISAAEDVSRFLEEPAIQDQAVDEPRVPERVEPATDVVIEEPIEEEEPEPEPVAAVAEPRGGRDVLFSELGYGEKKSRPKWLWPAVAAAVVVVGGGLAVTMTGGDSAEGAGVEPPVLAGGDSLTMAGTGDTLAVSGLGDSAGLLGTVEDSAAIDSVVAPLAVVDSLAGGTGGAVTDLPAIVGDTAVVPPLPTIVEPPPPAPADTTARVIAPPPVAPADTGVIVAQPGPTGDQILAVEGLSIETVEDLPSGTGGYSVVQTLVTGETVTLTVVPIDRAGPIPGGGALRVTVLQGGSVMGTVRFGDELVTARSTVTTAVLERLLRRIVQVPRP
jgi:hypothetical protein